ncbi:YppG family protein [Evansella halocellulosilytica]|uniref:YppG family protein n=1 Tax=Evansella halocellulosilytica TaxID=2011013 RepID=UPI000BB7CF7C|nr:YppG family protein [Evansella halocellulosilytica]
MLFPPRRPEQRPPYHQGMSPRPNQQHYWHGPNQFHNWHGNSHQTNQNPGNSTLNGIISAFQTPDGKFDINKAMTTVDQVVKTANQISPIVKQVGGFFIKK